MKSPRIVMVYVEPTPYIVALIDTLRRLWAGPIEAYYITADLSQPWALQLESGHARILPAGLFTSLRALWLVLARERTRAVLHLAGWGRPVLLAAILMAKVLGIPVAIESDTAEGRLDRSWPGIVKKLLYPLLFKLPNRFLPAGSRQVRYLTRFGVEQNRITVAQMTVDVCAIRGFRENDREAARSAARARWNLPAHERIVLYVGRLEEQKGLPDLLSAFVRVAEEEPDVRLVIAGDGSLRPRIEQAASADGRVTYLGRLSGDDVLRAYLAADFLALPSLFEPWGLVVNEAMASGLPVIVSDRVGCADDLVRDGETGLVFAAGDRAELSAAIRRLARDAPGRSRMGQAGESLISGWTLGHEAHNVISAWHEIAR